MVFKFRSIVFIGICFWFKSSSCLPEVECNLKVEIEFSEGVEPTIVCSSDCIAVGETFYYYDETLDKEYNSVVQVSYDDEGNLICTITPKHEEILKRKTSTNSTLGDKTETTLFESVSEVTSISSSYPDYDQDSVHNYTGFGESTTVHVPEVKDQYQGSESQNILPNHENITENAEVEYQYDTSLEVDKSTEEENDASKISEEKTDMETVIPVEDLQDESQESDEDFDGYESSKEVNTSNIYEQEMERETEELETKTEESKTETVISEEDSQNESQETTENFETIQQGRNGTSNQTLFPECSKGWTLNPDSMTCYFVTQNNMNWFDANIVCVQLGGKLSTFHNLEEVNFVKENVELPESSWIGLKYTLSDNHTFQIWRWIDSSVADFTDWASGEPSSETSLWEHFWTNENCVEMKKSKGFAWNDERCSDFRRALCSKKAEFLPRTICPDGWLGQGNKCYHFCPEEFTEEVAALLCSSHAVGSKLFVPEDSKEMDFISHNLKERNIDSIWLGIKNSQEDGVVRTPDGDLHTFFSWDVNEPSKSFWWFNTKECIKMSSESKMKKEMCGQELPFVCSLNL